MEEQWVRERSRRRSLDCGSIAEVDGGRKSGVLMLAMRRRAFALRALRLRGRFDEGRSRFREFGRQSSFVRSG